MLKKLLCILFLFPLLLFAQQKNLPLNREWSLFLEREINKSDSINITSNFKPYIESRSLSIERLYELNSEGKSAAKERSLFRRKLFDENLIIIKDTTDKFYLTIDPLFNLEFGKDLKDSLNEKLYKNTRGVLIRGNVGNKFSFESSFYENQATFVNYIDNFNDTFLVVPGQGRWKKFKTNGYDFAMASGYISYSPNRHFNFQLGHGKHFAGDGYRSLLLSDNAFNYPYLRITSTFGRFQYTNLYTSFMNLTDGGVITPAYTERLFQKKAGSFQFLSYNVSKRIQMGIFQGMIWEASDTLNKQKFDFYYVNPLLFVSPLKYGLKNTNNILLGATLKLKITNGISLYSQFVLDDFARDRIKGSLSNKQGYQVGCKLFDVFNLRNLNVQMEYNQVRPYTYAHTLVEQNYSNYNQSLAHPLGANFKEVIAFLNYRLSGFFAELKFSYAQIGADSLGRNYGNTIFQSDNTAFYGPNSTVNEMGQGVKTNLIYKDFKIGYLVNPSTNFNIILGVSDRVKSDGTQNQNTRFVYFGIRTSLTNQYFDF